MARHLLRSFLLVLVVLSIVVPTSSSTLAAEKLRYATAFKGPEYDMTALAAEERGFWKRYGLETKWFSMKGGSPTFQALAAGAIDMGTTQAITTIQAASRGLPAVVVADMGYVEDWKMWVRRDSPVKKPRDLKGGKVGTSRFGGAAHAFTLAFLRGLGLEKDVKIVAVGGLSSRIAALRSGAIDGFLLTLPPLANLKAKGEIRGLGSLRANLPRKWMGMVLFAGRKVVQEKPRIVSAGVKAILAAADFVERNPEWTLAKLKSYSRFSEEAVKEVYATLRFSKDGKIDPEALKNAIDFLLEYRIVRKEKAPALENIYTNQFVQ